MTIVVEEKDQDESGSSSGWTREFLATADGDDVDASALDIASEVYAYSPEGLVDSGGGVLIRADISLGEINYSPTATYSRWSVSYSPPEEGSRLPGDAVEPYTVEATYEFSYQAPSYHIAFALATTGYAPSGQTAPSFGKLINVRYDGVEPVADGYDLPNGNTTNIWRMTVPKGFVSSTYEAMVEGMVGSVNSADFKGRPAGSMRFVSVQSSQTRGGSFTIAWGFQYSKNETGLTIDGITGINRKGHEYMWRLDEKVLDLTTWKMILKARAVYVQQIFPTADFNTLGF